MKDYIFQILLREKLFFELSSTDLFIKYYKRTKAILKINYCFKFEIYPINYRCGSFSNRIVSHFLSLPHNNKFSKVNSQLSTNPSNLYEILPEGYLSFTYNYFQLLALTRFLQADLSEYVERNSFIIASKTSEIFKNSNSRVTNSLFIISTLNKVLYDNGLFAINWQARGNLRTHRDTDILIRSEKRRLLKLSDAEKIALSIEPLEYVVYSHVHRVDVLTAVLTKYFEDKCCRREWITFKEMNTEVKLDKFTMDVINWYKVNTNVEEMPVTMSIIFNLRTYPGRVVGDIISKKIPFSVIQYKAFKMSIGYLEEFPICREEFLSGFLKAVQASKNNLKEICRKKVSERKDLRNLSVGFESVLNKHKTEFENNEERKKQYIKLQKDMSDYTENALDLNDLQLIYEEMNNYEDY